MLVSRYGNRTEGCLTLAVPRDDVCHHRPGFRPLAFDPILRPIRSRSFFPDRPPVLASHSSINQCHSCFPDRELAPLVSDPSPLPFFDSGDFEIRFHTKLTQCLTRCTFDSSSEDDAARAMKATNLNDILKAIESPGNAQRFTASLSQALITMLRCNIERPLQMIDPHFVVTDDVAPFPDPEWEHLGIVYQILIRFQELAPRCPLINPIFLKMLFKQITTRDQREQNAIIQIVIQFASQARPQVFSSLFAALLTELNVSESSPNYMFGATVVLGITTLFIKEFPSWVRYAVPLIQRCLVFLTAPCFLFFKTAYFNFLAALISVDQGFTGKILKAAVRYWPYMTSSKQPWFLKIFAMTLPKLSLRQHANLTPRLALILSEAIRSLSARVSEGALNCLNDRGMEVFMVSNLRLILPGIYEAIIETGSSHWNHEVRDLARKTASKLATLDSKLYYEVAHSDGYWNKADAMKMQAWTEVMDAAARTGVAIDKQMAQIRRLFAMRKGPGRPESKLTRRQSVAPRSMHLFGLLPIIEESALMYPRES